MHAMLTRLRDHLAYAWPNYLLLAGAILGFVLRDESGNTHGGLVAFSLVCIGLLFLSMCAYGERLAADDQRLKGRLAADKSRELHLLCHQHGLAVGEVSRPLEVKRGRHEMVSILQIKDGDTTLFERHLDVENASLGTYNDAVLFVRHRVVAREPADA